MVVDFSRLLKKNADAGETDMAKSEEKNLEKYGAWTPEDAAEDREDMEKGGEGNRFSFNKGVNLIRLAPGKPGKKPHRRIWQHFVNWGETKTGFICSRQQFKKACYTCRKVEELKASKNKSDRKAGEDMFAGRKWIWNVLDRGAPDLGFRPAIFGKSIQESLQDLHEEEGDMTHPLKGYDIRVRKTGEGMKTKYRVKEGDACPISDDASQMTEWLETMPDLDAIVAGMVMSDEEQEEIFDQDRDDDDDDEDERPRGKRSKRGGGKRTAEKDALDDDDEDEDADIDDEDDDED